MNLAEFRRWAWECHRYRIPATGSSPGIRVPFLDNSLSFAKAGTGTGHRAEYGSLQQRRLTLWLRTRELIDPNQAADWIRIGETHDDGWLVNDGSGIRWVADPTDDWKALLASGFVAIRCGDAL